MKTNNEDRAGDKVVLKITVAHFVGTKNRMDLFDIRH